ncbi:hypothetical protein [Streptomyces nodosus]|uniref:hypothetical protein n=1 Tax=Streptomyces nodosus TaxID=40318 RepID=UPI0038060D71
MRPLSTDAERAEAGALVEERLTWLTRRGLPVRLRLDIPDLFLDQRWESVGLFEDGLLIGCMILDGDTDARGPALFLAHVHTLPGRTDGALRLITLWASDYAARCGLLHVRAEVLARHDLSVDPISRVLDRLQTVGWGLRGIGTGEDDERVARLELRAELRPLAPLIGCTVPLRCAVSSWVRCSP